MGSFSNDDGNDNKNVNKAIVLLIKQHLCTICKFLCRYCTISTWKCLISFVENGNFWQRFSFYSPDLRFSPLEFNSRRICQHCRIERDGINVISLKQRKFTSVSSHVFEGRWLRCCCPVYTYPHIFFFFLKPAFNSSRVDSNYECKTRQNRPP